MSAVWRALSGYVAVTILAYYSVSQALPGSVPPPVTSAPRIGIFVDGSGSMKGYLSTSASPFTVVISALGNVAGSITTKPVEIAKFGSSVQSVAANTFPTCALASAFFSQSQTLIGPVIDSAASFDISVILTDLYESSTTIDNLVNALDLHHAQRDRAVGILGVRSKFKGPIGAAGPGYPAFDCDTLHPFYLIILGKHRDVVHYYETLRALVAPAPDSLLANFVIVSPYVVEKTDVPITMPLLMPVPNAFAAVGSNGGSFKLKVKTSGAAAGDGTGTLRVNIPLKRLPYVLPVTGIRPGRLRLTPAGVKNWEEFLLVYPRQMPSGAFPFRLIVPTTRFPAGSVHVTVELPVNEQTPAFTGPAQWIADWTMSANTRDGTKTPNLDRFVRTLAFRYHPVLVRCAFDLEKN